MNAIEVTNVTKVYRRYARKKQFATLKSALLSGGDIVLVKGELGGAGFRVLLPIVNNAIQAHPDRG